MSGDDPNSKDKPERKPPDTGGDPPPPDETASPIDDLLASDADLDSLSEVPEPQSLDDFVPDSFGDLDAVSGEYRATRSGEWVAESGAPADQPPEKPAEKPARKPVKKKAKKPAREIPDLPRAVLKSSPHKTGTDSVPSIMYGVIIAMLPACAAACWFFGIRALFVLLGCAFGCVALEFGILRMRMRADQAWRSALDGSALITGILLALNLPASSPWWLVLVGCVVAMGLGKHSFGGLGQNPFNPALVARVFLLLSFPSQMTTWTDPVPKFTFMDLDAITGATPLGIVKTDGVAALLAAGVDWFQLFVGNMGGSLGEVSVLALLLGGGYMLARRIISWHIPVSYIGVVLALTGVMWLIDGEKYANPVFHLLTGGLMLGAFFMATDMVTSPVTARGMLIFGAGCGLVTAVIRLFGSFPEGVSFAILIMNGFVPLIERRTRPRKFGEVRPGKEAKAHA